LKYKLVIFDFDGTLADTFPFVLRIMDHVIDKYELRRLDPAEIELLRGYDARKIMKYVGVPMWKVPTIGNYVRSLLAEEIHNLSLFDGVDGVLKQLSDQGIQLAIASSNSFGIVRRILGPENTALIQYYECGVPLFGKQAKLKKILKKSGLQPGEAICIGYEIRDIQAAQKAKIPFGAVTWGFTNIAALEAHSPNEMFASVAEIVEKLS